ncbi:SIS domain-containing protein [Microbacterium trichothecenolyticum]|uniref:D-sedoheptulose-7-phosphate isomerase n=1 Tax=Microbacterium trichothecenolyticum TaxID=69370 RepID=UPI001C6DE601|nr:SIS domain-containing protein [Microbacterium trichothecenolyticum]MBW9121118.1 SIS domain-containing protein [Microbacterium trichothecenolyticum]
MRTTDAATPAAGMLTLEGHLGGAAEVIRALQGERARLERWGRELAVRVGSGARLLVAGNGGSAAEAQHLAAELTGRFRDDRRPYSAIALNTDTSAITAIGNDYGFDEVFARQVRAHGRHGDVLLLLSTSGASANLLRAAAAAAPIGMLRWSMTGPAPNPLHTACDDGIALPGIAANVQEAELVAVHALCVVFEHEITRAP